MGKAFVKHADQKIYKHKVILSASALFGLDEYEAECLANKAGLSLCADADFTKYFCGMLERGKHTLKNIYDYAQISERMFQYIKKGVIPSKTTLLAIAISLRLDEDDIQCLLKKAGYILSKSLANDSVVLCMLARYTSLNKNINPLWVINEVLEELEMPLLMTRPKNIKSQN